MRITMLLLALAAAAWASDDPPPGAAPPPPPPQFGLVPQARLEEGRAQLAALEASAAGETFLDRMLGTACYGAAVAAVRGDCTALPQEAKTRLALRLANCQLATQGQRTYPCADREPLRACVERLPDRDHALYVEFLTHVDSMCLFVQGQNFEKHTAHMLNALSQGVGAAREAIGGVGAAAAAAGRDAAAARAATEDALARLREAREMQAEAAEAAQRHAAAAAARFDELSSSQAAALALAQRQLAAVGDVEAATRGVEARLAQGHVQLDALFGAMGERAAALAAAQASSAAAQDALGAQLRALGDGSAGLRAAVDTVADYQRRSDAALVALLGRSYSLGDAAFYGAGAAAALAAGTSRATAPARLPMLAVLAATMAAERALAARLHLWLELDPGSGEVVLPVPPPAWLPAALAAAAGWPAGGTAPLALSFKWALRRVAGVLCALVLAGAALSHRDWDRATYRRLEAVHADIQAWQRRQEEEAAAFRRDLLRARTEALAAAAAEAAPPRRYVTAEPLGRQVYARQTHYERYEEVSEGEGPTEAPRLVALPSPEQAERQPSRRGPRPRPLPLPPAVEEQAPRAGPSRRRTRSQSGATETESGGVGSGEQPAKRGHQAAAGASAGRRGRAAPKRASGVVGGEGAAGQRQKKRRS